MLSASVGVPPLVSTVTASDRFTVTLTTSPVLNRLFWMPIASLARFLTVGTIVSMLMLRVPTVLILPAASVAMALRVSLPCPMAVMSSATTL